MVEKISQPKVTRDKMDLMKKNLADKITASGTMMLQK